MWKTAHTRLHISIMLQLKLPEFNLVVHMLTTQPNSVPRQYFLLYGNTNEVILPKAFQW